MKTRLGVYLLDEPIGTLSLGSNGMMAFKYASEWISREASMAISHSLPVREQSYRYSECRGYFAGLLPEGGQRAAIAANLGFSKQNDFALLEAIGGECAGAVTIIPEGASLPEAQNRYKEIDTSELLSIIDNLPARPLLAGDEGVRLSLAGAQVKIAVHKLGGKVSIPLYSSPSTHIIKPENDRLSGLVENEVFCMQLARKLGLKVAGAEIFSVGSTKVALIERYDRVVSNSQIKRLHQEDFCQALGIVSENKYQSEGGVSLKAAFELVRRISSVPVLDIQSLLDITIFNFLIGNNDAHGKNFSFLYKDKGKVELAPFYDLVSTRAYSELSKNMAMKIGKESNSEKISKHHFLKMAEELALSKPIVEERVEAFVQKMKLQIQALNPKHEIENKIMTLININCDRLI